MQLILDEQLKSRIPGVTFGMVTINGVTVRERDDRLWKQIEMLCQHRAREFSLDGLRVLKGQGLYQINTAVDVNNLCSLEFLLPMCSYDLRHVKGQVRVRIGKPGEEYPGIGRQVFQAENKVIIADDSSIMGSTVSDSERTKVSTETTDILLAIYGPANMDPRIIERYATLAGQRMVEFNGGQACDISALTVTI